MFNIHALYVLITIVYSFVPMHVRKPGMKLTFRHPKLTHLHEMSTDFTRYADQTANIENAFGSIVRKYRMLPINIGDEFKYKTNMSSDLQCVLCNRPFKPNNKVFALKKCNHMFHHACIRNWLIYMNQTCYVCGKHVLANTVLDY